jgi:GrpB-like predicted nucleotidyltransferase (UPF0157 family)
MQAIDEPIHLADYDAAWLSIFSAERKRIAAALSVPLDCLEHIGSTAVPNLAAKPIIDIMLGVNGWPPVQSVSEAITCLGYESLGEAGVPERLYFRRRGSSNFNLHLVRLDGNHWRSNIALREHLRGNKDARLRYEQAKRAAIAGGAQTLLAYSEAKSVVVAALLTEALTHQNVG